MTKKGDIESERRKPSPEEVVALRQRHGLSQAAAAERWFTSVNAVQKWETPVGQPNHRAVHPLMWWGMRRILGDKS